MGFRGVGASTPDEPRRASTATSNNEAARHKETRRAPDVGGASGALRTGAWGGYHTRSPLA